MVYRADQTQDEVFELFRTLFNGGTNSKLNPPYTISQDVETFVLLPDSSGVIYRADQATDGVSELYRVLFATAGTSNPLINPPLFTGQNVDAFAATPDSANVVYIANRPIGSNQIFIVPAGGGGSIPLNGPLVANGNVTAFSVTPDGLSVVYRADQDIDEVYELYRTVILSAPTNVKLNPNLAAGGDVESFAVTPDSTSVVYRADQTTNDIVEIFRTVFSGNVNSQLNPSFPATADVVDFALFPNGSGLVYKADQTTDGVDELYRVVFGFPGAPRAQPCAGDRAKRRHLCGGSGQQQRHLPCESGQCRNRRTVSGCVFLARHEYQTQRPAGCWGECGELCWSAKVAVRIVIVCRGLDSSLTPP